MGKQRIKNEKAAGEKAADEKVKSSRLKSEKQLWLRTFALSVGNGKIIEKVKPY